MGVTDQWRKNTAVQKLNLNKIAPYRRSGRSDFHRGDPMTLFWVVHSNCLGWSLGIGHKVNGDRLLVCLQFKLD